MFISGRIVMKNITLPRDHFTTFSQPQGFYLLDTSNNRVLADFYSVATYYWTDVFQQCVSFDPLNSFAGPTQKLTLVVQSTSPYPSQTTLYNFVVQIGSTCYGFAANSNSWPYFCTGLGRQLFPSKWIAPAFDGNCYYASMDISLPLYTTLSSICIGGQFTNPYYNSYTFTFTGQIELAGVTTTTVPSTNYQILQQCVISNNIGSGYVKLIQKTESQLLFDVDSYLTPLQTQCITFQPLRLVGNTMRLQVGFLAIEKNDITGLEIMFPESNQCYGGGDYAPHGSKYSSSSRCITSLGNYPRVWERGYLDPTCYSDTKNYNTSTFITAGVTTMCLSNTNTAATSGFVYRGQILLTGAMTNSNSEVNYKSTNVCQFLQDGSGGGNGNTISITNTSNNYHSSTTTKQVLSSAPLKGIIALLVLLLVLLSVWMIHSLPRDHWLWHGIYKYIPYCRPSPTIHPTIESTKDEEKEGKDKEHDQEGEKVDEKAIDIEPTAKPSKWSAICSRCYQFIQKTISAMRWFAAVVAQRMYSLLILASACILSVCCGMMNHAKVIDGAHSRGGKYAAEEEDVEAVIKDEAVRKQEEGFSDLHLEEGHEESVPPQASIPSAPPIDQPPENKFMKISAIPLEEERTKQHIDSKPALMTVPIVEGSPPLEAQSAVTLPPHTAYQGAENMTPTSTPVIQQTLQPALSYPYSPLLPYGYGMQYPAIPLMNTHDPNQLANTMPNMMMSPYSMTYPYMMQQQQLLQQQAMMQQILQQQQQQQQQQHAPVQQGQVIAPVINASLPPMQQTQPTITTVISTAPQIHKESVPESKINHFENQTAINAAVEQDSATMIPSTIIAPIITASIPAPVPVHVPTVVEKHPVGNTMIDEEHVVTTDNKEGSNPSQEVSRTLVGNCISHAVQRITSQDQ